MPTSPIPWYIHSAEKYLRTHLAMIMFTSLYISFDDIKSLSLRDIQYIRAEAFFGGM
jgi:hypothetical protein